METETQMRERLATLEQDRKSMHRRLDSLEELTESIHSIAIEIKAMREDVNDINRRVDEIERRPLKRYDLIVSAIITTVAGFLAGHFFSL